MRPVGDFVVLIAMDMDDSRSRANDDGVECKDAV